MKLYVCNTFSPMMQEVDAGGATMTVEISLDIAKKIMMKHRAISAISNSGAAAVISTLTGENVISDRISIELRSGDILLSFMCKYRPENSGDITIEKINSHGYRCFLSFKLEYTTLSEIKNIPKNVVEALDTAA